MTQRADRDLLHRFWTGFFESTEMLTRPFVFKRADLPIEVFTVEDGLEITRRIIAIKDVSVNGDGKLLDNPQVPQPPTSIHEYESFLERLAAANQSSAITFTRDGFQRYYPEVMRIARHFLHGFFNRTGLPARGTSGVFIGGKYRSTWIGLHNDFCLTFLFPLVGTKRMLLWEPDYFEKMAMGRQKGMNGIVLGHVDIAPFESAARLFHVDAGDLFFIPARWWHYNKLAESSTTMTISLGVFPNSNARLFSETLIKNSVLTAAENLQISYLPRIDPAEVTTLNDVALPAELETLINNIRSALRLNYLQRVTSASFVVDPRAHVNQPEILASTKLSGLPECPVFLLDPEASTKTMVANGQVARVSGGSWLEKFIVSVNSATQFSLNDLEGTQDTGREAIEV